VGRPPRDESAGPARSPGVVARPAPVARRRRTRDDRVPHRRPGARRLCHVRRRGDPRTGREPVASGRRGDRRRVDVPARRRRGQLTVDAAAATTCVAHDPRVVVPRRVVRRGPRRPRRHGRRQPRLSGRGALPHVRRRVGRHRADPHAVPRRDRPCVRCPPPTRTRRANAGRSRRGRRRRTHPPGAPPWGGRGGRRRDRTPRSRRT
jgi:hypothetical protein